ncbi:MAG: right-handed parallel beta-helix repeat-containing protein [Kiritimatiellia bacterium]|nr:right-handed parallel beta-helix repeat-containing protein [Kiritimatiellia bacterium]
MKNMKFTGSLNILLGLGCVLIPASSLLQAETRPADLAADAPGSGKGTQTATSEGRVRDFTYLSPQDALWTSPPPELSFIVGRLSQSVFPQKRFHPRSDAHPLGYHDGVPPWTPTYKTPVEHIPDLDIPGPDGLLYPNFTYAGVQGGIPNDLPIRVTLLPGGRDFAADLEAAMAETVRQGGGVIQLEAGTYRLNRFVGIMDNHIVIRGRGPEQTRIEFTFTPPAQKIFWHSPRTDGATLGPRDLLEVYADLDTPAEGTDNQGELRLLVDGQVVATTQWHRTEPSQFRASIRVRTLLSRGFQAGPHTVTAHVRWKDGSITSESRKVVLDPALVRRTDEIGAEAAILISSAHLPERVPHKESLPRGARKMKAPGGLAFQPGDYLSIRIGADPDWMRKVKAVPRPDGTSGLHRQIIVQVTAVENGDVFFNQPLRIPMEAVPSAEVLKLPMVSGCGIEDLTFTSVEKNWLHGVLFRQAVHSWIRNVHFIKVGRNPFETDTSKWIEIRDIEAHDAWFKQGGGTAYISFNRAFDCLLDGVKSSGLRHAPNLNWSSSGCVLRNGHYEDSDAQFHCGWPNENLFENNTVISRRGSGSYGYGFFAQGPEADIHGPQGPRNVLYNNDLVSDEAGLWLGGSSEAYLILHNRFVAKRGPAVFLKQGAFDNTFLGNVFVAPRAGLAAVILATPDCVGNDFIRNTFGGLVSSLEKPISLFAGAIPPARHEENRVTSDTDLPRPQPAVPSIYLWQLENRVNPSATLPKQYP